MPSRFKAPTPIIVTAPLNGVVAPPKFVPKIRADHTAPEPNPETPPINGENVKYYLDSKGDDVRLFFMPTSGDERIECINPVHISDKKELEKLNELTSNLEKLFHVGME